MEEYLDYVYEMEEEYFEDITPRTQSSVILRNKVQMATDSDYDADDDDYDNYIDSDDDTIVDSDESSVEYEYEYEYESKDERPLSEI